MAAQRTYLFDLDGTLTDARPGLHSSFRAALEAIGLRPLSDAELDRFLGTPLPEMFRTLDAGISDAGIERGIRAFRAAYEADGILTNELYPGVAHMLDAIAQRGRAAWIVTSKPQHYAIQVVQQLHIEHHFRGVIGAGLSETDTKSGLIAHAIERAGAAGEHALMLGDRSYDVVGAIANGVLPIGALWGYGSREELGDAGCTLFVKTPEEFTRRYVEMENSRPAPSRAGQR